MTRTIRVLSGVSMALLIAASSRGQTVTPTKPPSPPISWNVNLLGFYDYDTNPLRVSFGRADSHWRILPSFSLQAPLNRRTMLFARSNLRRDQFARTSLLNGLGITGSVGLTRRVAAGVSAWGAYDLSRSEQPDVLVGSPLRFASYSQQGVSGGLIWRTRRKDALRADAYIARRTYRGLASPLRSAEAGDQVDPLFGARLSWERPRRPGGVAWGRVGLNALWHRSSNPNYSYALPSIWGNWGLAVGPRARLELDGTLAWLRYDARRAFRRPVLRKDTITEVGATMGWTLHRRVEPFVRVSQQWDRSTDALRTFSDTRILVGARVQVWRGGDARR